MSAPALSRLRFKTHRGTWREPAAINLDGLFRSLSPVITARVLEGGPPNFQVTFDQGLQEWVNAADRIVADIVTVDGAAQIQMLTWHDDPSQRERVVWQSAGFNQQGQEQFAWITVNQTSGLTSVWRKKDGVFGFFSLSEYRTDNQLLP